MSDEFGNFGSPEHVWQVSEDLQWFENRRAQDRALIDNLFNGGAPYTDGDAQKLGLEDWNINWNEGGKILDDANRQINGALLFKPRLATLRLKRGPAHKRLGWSETATNHFNALFQEDDNGRFQMFLLKSRNASTSLHGIGALYWPTRYRSRKRFVPLEDLLIPTDTTTDHQDLGYFAINQYLTQGELMQMVQGDKHWNEKAIRQICHDLQTQTNQHYPDPFNPTEQPEKWQEYRKQNAGFYYWGNDQVPKVALRAFFYRHPNTGLWYRKVILRYGTANVPAKTKFIYDSPKPFAEKLSHFLHIQYADSSRVPPLQHHSVRGLGVYLYAPVECMNRVRCQVVRHLFENLLTWVRVKGQADKDRLKHFIFTQYAALPEELSLITAAERYQIDPKLVEMVQSQFRQLMNESSSSFVRDIEGGSDKEMTLGEAQIRLQQVNVQVSSMLRFMYAQEVFLYGEDLRRLLLPGSIDPLALEFLKRCKRDDVPPEYLVRDAWKVDIDQVLGSGDESIAQVKADRLLSQRGWMDPAKARIIERQWLTVTSGDPALAAEVVPETKDTTTSGTLSAQNVFGTLMQGTAIPPREGIDQQGYIEQMLTLLGEKVVQITQTDNVGTPAEFPRARDGGTGHPTTYWNPRR